MLQAAQARKTAGAAKPLRIGVCGLGVAASQIYPAFRDGTPYQGEDLYVEAAAPERFMPRCSRPGAGATPGTCLYERRIGAADIMVRFPRDWLIDWRAK